MGGGRIIILLWSIAGALTAGGVWLLIAGALGRRISDHPFCRRCGYDVAIEEIVGAATPAAALTRCPECGLLLSDSRAIRRGCRKRHPGLIFTGCVMIAFGGAGASAAAAFARHQADLLPLYPLWALRIAAPDENASNVDRVYNELLRRNAAGEITMDDVVSIGLYVQGRRDSAWLPKWGDMIEEHWGSGLLSKKDQERYTRQSFILSVGVVSEMNLDSPIEWHVQVLADRAGTNDGFQPFELILVIDGFVFHGVRVPRDDLYAAPSENNPVGSRRKWVLANGAPIRFNAAIFAPGANNSVRIYKRVRPKYIYRGTQNGVIEARVVASGPPSWPAGVWYTPDPPERVSSKIAEWEFKRPFQITASNNQAQ